MSKGNIKVVNIIGEGRLAQLLPAPAAPGLNPFVSNFFPEEFEVAKVNQLRCY